MWTCSNGPHKGMSLKRNQLRYSKPPPQNRQELLQSIERDRGVLGAYLQKLKSQQEDITTSSASAPLASRASSNPRAPPAPSAPKAPPALSAPRAPPAVSAPRAPPALSAPQAPPALSAPQAPPALYAPAAPPVRQRCSYDLFFESACITVKNLPPKLAAEAKSRISQIITEFEIRAIEMEALQQEQQTKGKCRSTSETLMGDKVGIVYKFHPCP